MAEKMDAEEREIARHKAAMKKIRAKKAGTAIYDEINSSNLSTSTKRKCVAAIKKNA